MRDRRDCLFLGLSDGGDNALLGQLGYFRIGVRSLLAKIVTVVEKQSEQPIFGKGMLASQATAKH